MACHLWCPHRPALHRVAKKLLQVDGLSEQCSVQGEGEGACVARGYRLPCCEPAPLRHSSHPGSLARMRETSELPSWVVGHLWRPGTSPSLWAHACLSCSVHLDLRAAVAPTGSRACRYWALGLCNVPCFSLPTWNWGTYLPGASAPLGPFQRGTMTCMVLHHLDSRLGAGISCVCPILPAPHA